MGNKVSTYLERFRDYCGKQLIEGKHYSFYGDSSYHSERKAFYRSFINNDVFNKDSSLHDGVFFPYDSSDTTKLLITVIEWVQNYIKSFQSKIQIITRSNAPCEEFKSLDDAVQLITIFRNHFTMYYGSEFNGTSHSFFDKNPMGYEYADDHFTGFLIPSSIIEARINGEYPNELDLTRNIGYSSTYGLSFIQFMQYFNQYDESHFNYSGIIFFTRYALKEFELNLGRDFIHYKVNNEDGYHFIEFECGYMKENDYIHTSSNKFVFHIEENGELFRLVASRIIRFKFNSFKHENYPNKYCGYCSDEKFDDYLANTTSKLSDRKTHIDIFV